MKRGQSLPESWLILDRELDEEAVSRMPRGGGVLALGALGETKRRRLRVVARQSGLTLLFEDWRTGAARVHNQRELTRALLNRAPLILISPIHRTISHPDWKPLSRMRAAALAKLAGRRGVALGGMDAKRYAKIAQLGFIGWAGISAWRTGPSRK